jgi:hypothetical protein
MKKIIYTLAGLLLLCLKLQSQSITVQYKVDSTSNAVIYPASKVVSDFGPRLLPTYDFHGGIDYSALSADGDLGYSTLALESGTIEVIKNLEEEGYKYMVVKGDHNFGYGHIFTSKSKAQSLGNFQVMACNGNWKSKYVIFNRYSKKAFSDCRIEINKIDYIRCDSLKVTFKDTIYSVTNMVDSLAAISPVGTSYGSAATKKVEAHLHLYNLQKLNGANTSASDENSLNPLQFVAHTVPSYSLFSFQNDNATVPGINFTYPGTSPSKIKIQALMSGQQDKGAGPYTAVMDINKIVFSISKNNDPFYQIEGKDFYSKIEYGGRTDANDVYPKKTGNNFYKDKGSWSNNKTGAEPKAYSSQPYDYYVYADFYSRIHKDHILGKPIKTSDAPSFSKYNDNVYEVKTQLITANTIAKAERIDKDTLDNFQPFITSFKIEDNGTQRYLFSRDQKEDVPNIVDNNNGIVSNLPVIEDKSGTWGNTLKITTLSSEPLKSCKLFLEVNSVWEDKGDMTEGSYGMEWSKTVDFASPGLFKFKLEGKDKNNNSLIDVYSLTNKNEHDKYIKIPTKGASNVWTNVIANANIGRDYFEVNVACALKTDFRPDISSDNRAGDGNCKSLINIKEYAAYNIATCSVNIGLDGVDLANFHVGWKNAAGEYKLGGTSKEVSQAGYHCYIVESTDGCCSIEGCIFIENMLNVKPQIEESLCNGASIDLGIDSSSFNITWTMTASLFPIPEYNNLSKIENLKGNLRYNYTITKKDNSCATTGMVILDDIINPFEISLEPLTFAASECNSTDGFISFLPYSINGGAYPYLYQWSNGETTMDLKNIPHGQYTLTVTDANGCQDTKMYDLKFVDQIEVRYDYVERPCPGQAKGYLFVLANQKVHYECAEPYWKSDEPVEFESLAAGTYCITMTSDLNDCILEKCYTIEDLEYQGPIVIKGAVKKTCQGENNGSVTLSIRGGIPNIESPFYSATWSNGGEGKYLDKGTYIVTVTDHCGNTATSAFDVEEYPYLPLDIQSKPTGTYIANLVLGGSGNFSYKWEVERSYYFNGILVKSWGVVSTQPGNTINLTQQQRFTVIDNITGCFKIKYFDCIALSSSQLNTCVGWNEGKIDISLVYGQDPITYKWSNGASTMDLDKLAKGNYTLTASNKTKDGNPLCSVKLDFTITDAAPEKQTPVFNNFNCGWDISCNNSSTKFKPYTGSEFKETPVGCNEIDVYCPTTGETKTKTLPLIVEKDFDLCAKIFTCPNTREVAGIVEFPKETRFVGNCQKQERCSLGNFNTNTWVNKGFVDASFCCPSAITSNYDTITGILTITVTALPTVNVPAKLRVFSGSIEIIKLENINLQNATYNWTIAPIAKGDYTLRIDFEACPFMESNFSVKGTSETPVKCPLILSINPNPLLTNTNTLDLEIKSDLAENLTLKVLDNANKFFTSKTINLIAGRFSYSTTFDRELLAFTPFHLVFEKEGCKTSFPILANEAACPKVVFAYPNQFTDKINLVAFSEMDLNATLNFINTAPPYNVVLSKNIHFSIGENNIQLDIKKDNIPNILYKLEVVFNNSTCNKIIIGEKRKVELKSPDPECFKTKNIDTDAQGKLIVFDESIDTSSNPIINGIVINPLTLHPADTSFTIPNNGLVSHRMMSVDGNILLFSSNNNVATISKINQYGTTLWAIPFQNVTIESVAPIDSENGDIILLLKSLSNDYQLIKINNNGNTILNRPWIANNNIPLSFSTDYKIYLHNDNEYSVLIKTSLHSIIYNCTNQDVNSKQIDSNFDISSIFKKYAQLYIAGTSNQALTIDNVSYQGNGYNSPTIMSLNDQLQVDKMKIHNYGSDALFVTGLAIDSNKIASIIHIPAIDTMHPADCDEVIIIQLDSCICNPPSIQYDSLSCLLYWQSLCEEDSTVLQISSPNSWVSLSGNTTSFYDVLEKPGVYRLVSYFGTCPTLYSNEINVNCDTTTFCPATSLTHDWVTDSINVNIDLVKNLAFDLRVDYIGYEGIGNNISFVTDSLFIPLIGNAGLNTYKFDYDIIYEMPSNPNAQVSSYIFSIRCPLCIAYCVSDSSGLAFKPNEISVPRNTESAIIVYPNPFGKGFTIDVDAAFEKNMAIEVYNATGILIYKDNLPLASHKNRYYLKESEFWQNGLYYIHFKDSDSDVTKKIIKLE